MSIDWEGAAPHLLSENGPSRLRLVLRIRSQSISSLTSFIVTNEVTTSAHLAVCTHAVLISCSGYAHLPAFRLLALEVTHEPLTISQHPHPRLMAHGLSSVITGVLTAALRRFVCLHRVSFGDSVGLRVYVEDKPIYWPLTIGLIRDAQAERGAGVSRWCPLWG